ncbi:MAG: hypothetical protein ACM3UW_06250 [Bacillota bacterium]
MVQGKEIRVYRSQDSLECAGAGGVDGDLMVDEGQQVVVEAHGCQGKAWTRAGLTVGAGDQEQNKHQEHPPAVQTNPSRN